MSDEEFDQEQTHEPRRLSRKEAAKEFRKAAYQRAKVYKKEQQKKSKEALALDPERKTKQDEYKKARVEQAKQFRKQMSAKHKELKKNWANASEDRKNSLAQADRDARDAQLWNEIKPAVEFPPLRLVKTKD